MDIGGGDGGGGGGVREGAVALALLGSRRGQAADAVASSARSRLRARWGRVSSARGCIRGRLRR